MTFTAHFTPEAWQRDQTIEVDPLGPQEWDCTEFAGQHRDYVDRLFRTLEGGPSERTDTDDVFRDDPAAPVWVREWRGPFTITIRAEPPASKVAVP